MLNALITSGEKTAILTLPSDSFTLQYELAQIGIRKRLTEIPINDDEEQDIQIKLFADSDIGNNLAVLFNPIHCIESAVRQARHSKFTVTIIGFFKVIYATHYGIYFESRYASAELF